MFIVSDRTACCEEVAKLGETDGSRAWFVAISEAAVQPCRMEMRKGRTGKSGEEPWLVCSHFSFSFPNFLSEDWQPVKPSSAEGLSMASSPHHLRPRARRVEAWRHWCRREEMGNRTGVSRGESAGAAKPPCLGPQRRVWHGDPEGSPALQDPCPGHVPHCGDAGYHRNEPI